MMKLLKTTAVRFTNTRDGYGAVLTLPTTIRDLLDIQPGEDYLEWWLDGNNVIVRKAKPKKAGK